MLGGSSFWVAFAKTLPFMLLCGIVGPIFVVLHFLIDDPTASWLLPWGVIITIMDVGLAALVAAGNSGSSRLSSWRSTSWRSGAELYGTIQPAPLAQPEPALGTPAARLAELDELMRKDLVSTEEYEASRKRILGEL